MNNDNENVPLLRDERDDQVGSTSSSNVYDGSNVNPSDRQQRKIFRRPKSYSFTDNDKSLKKRIGHQNYSSIPSGSAVVTEHDEVWVKNQKEFISRSGKKASMRKRIAFLCDTSRIGRIWELFDSILSAMFVLLYIWVDDSEEAFPYFLQTADFVLATIIFVQYVPRVWLDKEPLTFIFANSFSILTWFSVSPVIAAFFLTIFDDVMDNTYMGAGNLELKMKLEQTEAFFNFAFKIYIYPVRFIRLHWAVQMVFAPVKSSLFQCSKIMRKGLRLVTTILFTFLTLTALIHLVTFKQSDKQDPDHPDIESISFSDAFYFTVLSSTNGMSTDLVPDSTFTRAVILYVMFAGALFIPTALSELLTLIQEKSKYDHSYKGEKYNEHIIVTGDFDATSLFEFLREFFCLDHGLATMNTYVVIMHPDEPDEEIVEFLEDPAFISRVQYIKGTPTWRRSLEKIRADTASAAFLLTKKFSDETDEMDASQIMRALAIKKYNRKLALYAQVHLPENVPHFDFLAKDVICIDEITMGLMAQSLATPGFASLIVLLTTSITDKTVRLGWVKEYIHGLKHEIYAVTFSDAFVGYTFLECSELIYSRLGAVLFSIGVYKLTKGCFTDAQLGSNTSPFQIFLNPQDYMIKGNEIGFVISDCAEITAKMAKFNERARHWYDPYKSVSFLAKSAHNILGIDSNRSANVDASKFKLDANKNIENDEYSTLKSPRRKVPISLRRTNSFTKVEVDGVESVAEEHETTITPLIPLSNSKSNAEILRQNIERVAAICMDSEEPIFKSIKDHIIICDQSKEFPENLDIFISVLREKNSLCRNTPVVILCNSKPNESNKRILEKYGQVYFVRGSPLRRKDLFRARVNYAKKCVVLSDATRCEENSYGTADAASIMIALNIESLSNDCYVLVECIYRETFKMIGESDSVKNKEEEFSNPSTYATFVYGRKCFHAIFYNRHIPVIMKCLIFSHESDDEMMSPKIERQKTNEWRDLGIVSGHMFHTNVPPLYIGQTYNALYCHLIRAHKAISLGLYRTVTHKGGPHQYVFVNPRRDTIVRGNDKIYLIASKLPSFYNETSIIEE
ncbi:13571_t:CDS:10 [Funneliformis mosseae]|uniref:13571_t:CDS:1 n=1 Tax=Funneliformis mosseae TaxID=27381 RepID=A0A9N8ZLR3_FUNMO|nr:13571_t:CDS:10 [Funneliformis mosseae]